MYDISVVVLTYNRNDAVESLVSDLRKYYGNSLSIVVSDDGSDPRPNLLGKCTYLWQEDIGNRAATARNAGVARAPDDKILFLDSDVKVHPLCVRAHSLALELFDISIGMLPTKDLSEYYDSRTRVFISHERLWKFAWSGNLAIRKSVFEKLGGFDELFNGGHGFEDLDLSYRANEAGYRFHLNRLAYATHDHPHTFVSDNDKTIINKRKFEQKHQVVI